VELYAADYLGDLYSDWVIDRRRILQRRYFDALRQLVNGLFQNRQFERALRLCRRGIEHDFYREELHRTLMLCLVELGRLTEALTHYDTLSLRLVQELHTQPEAETVALAARIRSQ